MEDDILKDGYLDLKINSCIDGFRCRYKEEYNCLKEIDSFFYKIQDELIKKGANQQNTFIMASLVQLQKLYDSSILLFERGLVESGNTLIRPILELSFKIIEVISNDEFVEDLLLDEQYENLKLMKDIEEHKLFELFPENQLKEHKEIIEERIDSRKRPKTKSNYLAEKNGLYREYILYRLQCEYVHQSTGVIGRTIKVTSDGKIYVDADLQLKDFKKSIAWLLSITTISIEIILRQYIKNEDLSHEYNRIIKKFEIYFKELI